MKTVSVVVPNYNNSKYIGDCIRSIQSQTYPIDEIVIYDDLSTDNSRELLKELAAADNRIRLMFADENRGVSFARDTAIRSCHSEYVTTLDADDTYYDKDKIKREMDIINECSEMACAFSQTVLTDEGGNVTGNLEILDLQKDFRYKTITQSIGVYVARDFCMPVEAYKQVGGYVHDMTLFEDWDLSLKLLSVCPFYFSGGHGTAYRQKNSGLSDVSQKKILKAKLRGHNQARAYLKYTFGEEAGFYFRTYYQVLKTCIRKVMGRI